MERIRQDIKSNTFASVYLLFGEETYLVRSYKEQLKQAIAGDDTMNYTYFEGKNISLEEVVDIAHTMPFFAEHRLVLLENTGVFKSAASQGWLDLVNELPKETHLLFTEREVDKRSKLYKAVQKQGYAAEMKRQKEGELKRWILGGFARKHLKITEEALELFLNKTGDDMENIRMEMEKLEAYCIGREGITAVDVEEICTERLTNRVFDMIQAVAEGNTQKALELYYDLLALKESGMKILFLIARQMNQIYCTKEMVLMRAGKDQIAAKLKIRSFIADKLMRQARQFTLEQLKNCVSQCVMYEEAIKSGTMSERIAVEMVLLSISARKV